MLNSTPTKRKIPVLAVNSEHVGDSSLSALPVLSGIPKEDLVDISAPKAGDSARSEETTVDPDVEKIWSKPIGINEFAVAEREKKLQCVESIFPDHPSERLLGIMAERDGELEQTPKRELLDCVSRVVRLGSRLPTLVPEDVICRIRKVANVEVKPAPHAPDNLRDECEIWIIEGLPNCTKTRYNKLKPTLRLFCRPCYPVVYDLIKARVNTGDPGPILVTGIPGIGKSMFSIYFLLRALTDKDFPVKDFILEYEKGCFHQCFLDGDLPSVEDAVREFKMKSIEITGVNNLWGCGFIISDHRKLVNTSLGGMWHCIFSSPNPVRYKEQMKFDNSMKLTMPAWSREEMACLELTSEQSGAAFKNFGGVPRLAVMADTDSKTELDQVVDEEGSVLMENFIKSGFNYVDQTSSYMLTHINPPALPVAPWWDFCGYRINTFASEHIQDLLYDKHMSTYIAQAKDLFSTRDPIDGTRRTWAGALFERLVLWLEPIDMIPLVFTLLDSQDRLTITLPKIIPLLSRSDHSVVPENTYVPQSSNFPSGDAFCVIKDPQDPDKYILVVLQVTIGARHPIKLAGLTKILNMYSEEVQSRLSRKYLAFVTSLASGLDSVQPILGEDRRVLVNGSEFTQIVYRHWET